ncbi:hypothetical protein [Hominifimenecus sp. rT4P-3]|uniref:hypothetical protein n=1 Tax=Hominifimenecus sp. rT4P-3 TaxID=3242979 RepID=UPI003DA60E05
MNFYYNRETLHFTANWDVALTDRYQYLMAGAALAAGHDLLIPAQDLQRLYSPEMKIQLSGEKAVFVMNDRTVQVESGSDRMFLNGNPVRLSAECRMENGLLYVPVGQLMSLGFEKTVRSTGELTPSYISPEAKGIYNPGGILSDEEMIVAVGEHDGCSIDGALLRYIDLIRRGKRYGEQYRTYWMDGPQKVIPYITYIPTSYQPGEPAKMVVFLHGGSYDLGEKYAFRFAGHKLQMACEKYHYILLCANACTLLSSYGNMPPHIQACGTEEEKQYYQWGDDSVMQAIAEVKKEYAIDEKHIYLMGNSMGAGGTFYLPTVHPGMFRALAPGAGSLKVMCPEHLEALDGMPIIYPAGTEDDFGFDHILESRDMLTAAGAEVEMAVVGGGHHLDAWVDVIDDIFRFFEKHA